MTNKIELRVLYTTTEWEEAPFIMDQVNMLKNSGIHAIIHKLKGNRNPFNYFIDRVKLYKIIKNENIDLIHAHYGQCGFISKFKGIPLITTFHGSDSIGIVGKRGRYTFIGKILKLISKISKLLSSKCLFVSEDALKSLNGSKKCEVIPCGINTKLFKPMLKNECKEKLKLKPDKKYILFAGSPSKRVKNYRLALQSFKELKSIKNNSLKIIPLEGYSHSDVRILLNAVDALLMTSHHEGSPMIIKEAMSCNTPIVSVNVGDVKEMIGQINGCYIIEKRSPTLIAEKLKAVLDNTKQINSRRVAEKIDLSLINERLISVYGDIMAESIKNKNG